MCRWEPVPQEWRLRLIPKDSLLVMEAEGYHYRLEGWPEDVPDMPLFVGDQYRPMPPGASSESPTDCFSCSPVRSIPAMSPHRACPRGNGGQSLPPSDGIGGQTPTAHSGG